MRKTAITSEEDCASKARLPELPARILPARAAICVQPVPAKQVVRLKRLMSARSIRQAKAASRKLGRPQADEQVRHSRQGLWIGPNEHRVPGLETTR